MAQNGTTGGTEENQMDTTTQNQEDKTENSSSTKVIN